MDDCIEAINRHLRLTEKEDTGVVIGSDDTSPAVKNGSLCLVGKILSNKLFKGEHVLDAMNGAWQIQGELEFKAVGNNLFFFQFSKHSDLLMVKSGGPWHFNNNAILLQHFNGDLTLDEYHFDSMKVWIHAINPSQKCLTKACAKLIGNSVGLFIEWDHGPNKLVWPEQVDAHSC